MSSHYRRPIDFGPDRLDEIERGLQTFYRAFERFAELTGERFDQLAAPTRRGELEPGGSPLLQEIAEHREQFLDAMDDDFNTGGAIGELFEIVHALNRFANQLDARAGPARPGRLDEYRAGMVVLKELSQILGLFRRPAARRPSLGRRPDRRPARPACRPPHPAPQGEELRAGRRDPQPARRAGRDPRRPPRRHPLADRAAALTRMEPVQGREDRPGWPRSSTESNQAAARSRSRPGRGDRPRLERDGLRGGRAVAARAVRGRGGRDPPAVAACKAMGQRLAWIHQGIVEVLEAFPPGSVALEQVHSHVQLSRAPRS